MTGRVELVEAMAADFPCFARRLQAAFTAGAVHGFGYSGSAPIPADDEVEDSLHAPGAVVLHLVRRGERVGGAVVSIDPESHHNSLDMFFVDGTGQNGGVGFAAWQAIEARYPETRVWTTMTPYFDTRNIHFYVNKCGFRIIEFFHPGHPDPDETQEPHDRQPRNDGTDRMFSFEKVMPVGGATACGGRERPLSSSR